MCLLLLRFGLRDIELVDMAISPEEKKVVDETNSDDDVLDNWVIPKVSFVNTIALIIY